MKKAMRIFSVALALVLMLSVFVIPTSAADVNVGFSLNFAPVVGEVDEAGTRSEDANVYKLTLSMSADCRIATIIMDVNYDPDLMTPIDENFGSINYDYLCDPDYPTVAFNKLGTLTDNQMYNRQGAVVASRGLFFGAAHSSGKVEVTATYKAAGVVLFMYEIGDKTLMPGMSDEDQLVEMYFRLNDGVTAADLEGAKFSFGTGVGVSSKSIGYDARPVADKFFAMTAGGSGANAYEASLPVNILPLSDIATPEYIYSNKVVAPELTVKYFKDQIRFQKAADGSYADKFDYRILAELDNFDEVFADLDDAKARISDVGFIFNKGAAIDMAAAKAQVEGGAKTYSQVGNIYVSTSFAEGKYVMACFVGNIPDADKGTALSALAYVIYEQDGVTKYAYFDAAQTSPFTTLYNQYYPQAFGA